MLDVKKRLEYLREQIEKECISTAEIAELQGLAKHIDRGDTLLLQWAGVPEFKESKKAVTQLNIVTCGDCGRTFGHELEVKELTCPYCKMTSDICDFPDAYYPPEHQDSIINIEKHKGNAKMKIDFTMEDAESLFRGETFDWTFETNRGESIDIHLFNSELKI